MLESSEECVCEIVIFFFFLDATSCLLLRAIFVLWFSELVPSSAPLLRATHIELLEGKSWEAPATPLTSRSTKLHCENAWTHSLHPWTTSHACSLGKHLLKRATATLATLACSHLTESLSKQLFYATVAEELSENFIRVYVGEVWTACIHVFPKSVIVPSFAFITQTSVGSRHFLERLLRTR